MLRLAQLRNIARNVPKTNVRTVLSSGVRVARSKSGLKRSVQSPGLDERLPIRPEGIQGYPDGVFLTAGYVTAATREAFRRPIAWRRSHLDPSWKR
jgi:hypothetical protein